MANPTSIARDLAKRAFDRELIAESLEEASFLFEQIERIRQWPQISWTALASFEQRLEAHLAALELQGRRALDMAGRNAERPGGWFVAARLATRLDDRERFRHLMTRFEGGEETQAAVAHALHGARQDWSDVLETVIELGPEQRAVALRATGRATVNMMPILKRLIIASPDCLAIDAVARIGPRGDAELDDTLRALGRDEDPALRTSAVRALLAMGNMSTHGYVVNSLDYEPTFALEAAMVGGRNVGPSLMKWFSGRDTPVSVVRAAGLLGDARLVPGLLNLLTTSLAKEAAWSLHILLGAEIWDDVFYPDEVDEDELFEGETPEANELDVDDGVTVTQPAVSPEKWTAWIAGNAEAARVEERMLLGRPHSDLEFARAISHERYPLWLRTNLVQDRSLRKGAVTEFEARSTVAHQRAGIEAIHAGFQNETADKVGVWEYFRTEVRA